MRPFVFINIAMSADGKISTRERRQVRISGTEDFSRVDRIKAESDAIMVGIGTVLADDPSLTVKSPELRAGRVAAGKDEHPIRIVVDSAGRTPTDADILQKGTGNVSSRSRVQHPGRGWRPSRSMPTSSSQVMRTSILGRCLRNSTGGASAG